VEDCHIKWDLEEKRFLQQIPIAMQASLPLKPHNLPESIMKLSVLVLVKDRG
jgi:hypothetical protein